MNKKISLKAEDELEEIKKKMVPVLRKHGVARAGIFGSFVRGETGRKSDIDILVKFKGRKSLLDLVGLKLDLENEVKRRVDVVEYSAIHPLIKDRVFREQVKVL